MRYLLDANVVIVFQKIGALDELLHAAKAVPLVMADLVHQELTEGTSSDPAVQASIAEATRKLPGLIQIARPEPDSEAAKMYIAFRTRRSDKNQRSGRNKGEDESVAIALTEPDLVFVCQDGGAFRDAASELGGDRVLSFYPFLKRLVEQSALPVSVANEIAQKLAASSKSPTRDQAYALPLWWPSWLATLPLPPYAG